MHPALISLAIQRRCVAVLTACILSGGLSVAAGAASNPFFDQGTSYYQRGDYLAASAAFSWAVRQTPGDANAHYCLANTLVKLGRVAEAQPHYVAAIRLTKDPTIKNYSELALNGMSLVGRAPFPGPGLQVMPGGIANRSMVQYSLGSPLTPQMAPGSAPGGAAALRAMSDDPRQRANQMIDQQADRTSAGMLIMGNGEAASAQREGQYKADLARTRANRDVRDMQSANYKNIPLYSADDMKAAQQRGDLASLDAQQEANQKSLEAVTYAKAKVWETQTAAKNLQEQLNAPVAPGGAKLKAEGTNLYVRNFDTPIIDPGPAMKASPDRLQDFAPLTATPKSLDDKRGTSSGGKGKGDRVNANSSAKVYGQVLDGK